MKLCRNCRWVRPTPIGVSLTGKREYTFDDARCGRQDPVAGERGELCRVLRQYEGDDFCGSEAKWFEEAPPVTTPASARGVWFPWRRV
jgi:hypothetical protein